MPDWKEHLGKQDEDNLNDIIHGAEKYRKAYRFSQDIAVSQLWAAVLEQKKRNEDIKKRIEIGEALARKQKPVVIEKMVRESVQKSYWQLPVGAVPLLLSLIILSNISMAESASELSFAGSLFIAFSMIVFAGILWFSTLKD